MQLTILPIPDVPSVNGVVFTKRSMNRAISHYVAKYVTKGIAFVSMEKLSFDTTSKKLLETPLDKVVGQITSIEYDDESKSYKATVKFKDNIDVFENMKDSIVLLTSKLGVVSGNSVCDDENLKIVKMTVDYDPRLKALALDEITKSVF